VTEVETRVVEQTVRIAASPEVVWRYWVESERMATWFGERAQLDPRPGGGCRVEMQHGPIMVGEYVELVPPERVVFTFGWESGGPPEIPPGSTRVEVTLVPDGDGTVLTLRHSELPASAADRHAEGWAEILPILVERAGR